MECCFDCKKFIGYCDSQWLEKDIFSVLARNRSSTSGGGRRITRRMFSHWHFKIFCLTVDFETFGSARLWSVYTIDYIPKVGQCSNLVLLFTATSYSIRKSMGHKFHLPRMVKRDALLQLKLDSDCYILFIVQCTDRTQIEQEKGSCPIEQQLVSRVARQA